MYLLVCVSYPNGTTQLGLNSTCPLSREFRDLIERMQLYEGVLEKDGKTIHMSWAATCGYEPKIELKQFIEGIPYATAVWRTPILYCMKEHEEEVNKMNKNISW